MTDFPMELGSQEFYSLILSKDDSYNDDARLFVNFLRRGNYGVTLEGLEEYSRYLDSQIAGKRYSAHTYNKRLQGAKERLRYLFENSPSAMNAVTRLRFEEALKAVKLKKVNSSAISEDNVLSEEEVKRLIIESTDKTVSVMIEFLFATGLRISEMLGVLLTDIVRSNGKCIIRVLGKRRKERKVYVATALVDQVKEQFHSSTYLFEHNGQPYNRISITNRITTQGRAVLGRQISAHTFRHSFATVTLKRTNNLKGVSKYLGHSSVSTTANLYVHSELTWEDVNSSPVCN